MNGQSPDIVEVVSTDADVVRLRYVRPSDGKVWSNDCRLSGNRMVWRMIDVNGPGTGPGRWRESVEDEVVTYAANGSAITVTTAFAGEAANSKSYTVK